MSVLEGILTTSSFFLTIIGILLTIIYKTMQKKSDEQKIREMKTNEKLDNMNLKLTQISVVLEQQPSKNEQIEENKDEIIKLKQRMYRAESIIKREHGDYI